jgi:hypothetical protein
MVSAEKEQNAALTFLLRRTVFVEGIICPIGGGVHGRIVTATSGLAPLAETRMFAAQPVRVRQNHWLHTAAASGANQPAQFTNQLSKYDNAPSAAKA